MSWFVLTLDADRGLECGDFAREARGSVASTTAVLSF
jgi:hypothetical protein